LLEWAKVEWVKIFPNRHFVFTSRKGISVGSLDSRDVRQVAPENSVAIYTDGKLLYVHNQVLVAQTFDADRLRLSGEVAPNPTASVVNATGQVRLSVSETGVLIFQGEWEREYQFNELEPELSQDGKWVAYISDESGSYEIYVQSFTTEGKLGAENKRISTNGGIVPNWSSDGKDLFYVDKDGQIIAVAVNTSSGQFQTGAATALFKTRMFADASVFHEFAVSHDGQRFLIGTLIGETKSPQPTVILNWPAALKNQ
jgi:hypothetical protein